MFARAVAKKWDFDMSKARADLDWEKQINLAMNPEKVKRIRDARPTRKALDDGCSMCGDFCAIKVLKQYIRAEH